MLRRFIRWLFIWAFKMDIKQLIKECVYVQMKALVDEGKLKPENVPADIKLKCRVLTFTSREGKTLESHSICHGELIGPVEARKKLGTDKLVSTVETVHLI